jgi:hydroxymethylpyrimidine/phosphomethylpyrimidine kinase
MIPRALTIAGSDPTGGAGIQADLKTFAAHGVYGLSAIAAITAQSTLGVSAIHPIRASLLSAQFEGLLHDIPFRHVKIGMLYSREAVQAVTDFVRTHDLVAVLDTPFAAKDGTPLIEDDAFDLMRSTLLPLVENVTPNIPEAERLTGMRITTEASMSEAAHLLLEAGAHSVLLKGAHLFPGNTRDLFVNAEEELWLEGEFIATRHTHGTGCTLSAAIAANLALGRSTIDSVGRAKAYVNQAIAHAIPMGEGHGPLGHFHTMQMQAQVEILLP